MDNNQNSSAMGRVIAQMDTKAAIQHGTDVVDMKDIALKFVIDNMEYLQTLVNSVKPHPVPDNEDKRLIKKYTGLTGDESEELLENFLKRHNIPTCCRFYFELTACGTSDEQSIFVAANDVQATFMNAYISKIYHHFNKEWTDPEEYLLSTVSKIRKRARALYKIQYIYPSKFDHNVHHTPICCSTNHPKMYHYINSRGGLGVKYFLKAEHNVVGMVTYKTMNIVEAIDELVNSGKSIIISFPEFVKNLGKDVNDFKKLCEQMTIMDIINNWRSYWLMRFFMDAYEDNFKQFAAQPEDEESPNTKN